MRGYTQLTRDERYQIYALRKAGHSQKEIAEVLRRNPSTISRELGRNKGLKGYRPEQAHRLAQNRKKERDRTRIPESTWARVEQLLREDWSPEQISGWLTREEGVSVSHERIYQHVYEDKRRGGDLHRHLQPFQSSLRRSVPPLKRRPYRPVPGQGGGQSVDRGRWKSRGRTSPPPPFPSASAHTLPTALPCRSSTCGESALRAQKPNKFVQKAT